MSNRVFCLLMAVTLGIAGILALLQHKHTAKAALTATNGFMSVTFTNDSSWRLVRRDSLSRDELLTYRKRLVVWVSYLFDGQSYMAGIDKDGVQPEEGQTDFTNGYCIVVQGEDATDVILFHNCCTTNVIVLSNYTGTIQVGTNLLKYADLVRLKS